MEVLSSIKWMLWITVRVFNIWHNLRNQKIYDIILINRNRRPKCNRRYFFIASQNSFKSKHKCFFTSSSIIKRFKSASRNRLHAWRLCQTNNKHLNDKQYFKLNSTPCKGTNLYVDPFVSFLMTGLRKIGKDTWKGSIKKFLW